MGRLRLSIQKVPRPIARANLSVACAGVGWPRLSQQVIAVAGGRCAICGRRGRNVRIHCHEKWQYLDNLGVARLVGLQALCTLCHGTVHSPDVQTVRPGKRFRGPAFWLKRCCRINGCTPAEWERHEEEARQLWEYRSALAWRVDLGPWAPMLPAKRRKARWLLPKGRRVEWWPPLMDRPMPALSAAGVVAVKRLLADTGPHLDETMAALARLAGIDRDEAVDIWR